VHDIRLIAIDERLLASLTPGGAEFEAAYGATPGGDVNHVREIVEQTLDLAVRRPRAAVFGGYLVADSGSKTVVGTCGFRNGPEKDGSVEIAYHTFAPFEGRGYSTAAARAMIELASAQPGVRRIIAHTLPKHDASPRILEKVGMRLVGEVIDPEDGTVWEWEIAPQR
jgi:ribosomal-protein-alanine N-acetyltransferase